MAHPKHTDSKTAEASEKGTESAPAAEVVKESMVVGDKPVEILNKIVAKDVVKRAALNYRKDGDGKVESPEPRSLYRIFGVARDVKHGDSQYGQWTAFLGSFEAVRFSDQQRFQAPQAFLQGASEGLLLDALLTADRKSVV